MAVFCFSRKFVVSLFKPKSIEQIMIGDLLLLPPAARLLKPKTEVLIEMKEQRTGSSSLRVPLLQSSKQP